MQSGGAEMLRLAANLLCDADLVPNMLVHDGILLELDNDEQVRHAIEIMERAGLAVCGGLKIGVDVDQRLEGGARYQDKRPMAQEDVGDGDGRAAGDRGDAGGGRCQAIKSETEPLSMHPRGGGRTRASEGRPSGAAQRAGGRRRPAAPDGIAFAKLTRGADGTECTGCRPPGTCSAGLLLEGFRHHGKASSYQSSSSGVPG